MNRIKLILVFIVCVSLRCSYSLTPQEEFHNELGDTKSKSFNALAESFELFLARNYPNKSTSGERIHGFLTDILNNQMDFAFDSLAAKDLLDELEKSGLRKDIYLYRRETYSNKYNIEQFLPKSEEPTVYLEELDDNFEDIICPDTLELTENQKQKNFEKQKDFREAIDRLPNFNGNGLFLFALTKSMKTNQSFLVYCEIKTMGIDIDPSLLASGYLNNLANHEYELWYNKIPLLIDIFLYQLLVKYGNK